MLGFRRFGVLFELVLHSDCIRPKKGVHSQCRLEWYFLAGRKQITSSQSTCIGDDLLFDRLRSLVSRRFDSGPSCEMTCFCLYIAGTIWFILFTNTTLNRFGFWMLTVGTAIFHKTLAIFWLHLLNLLFPVATNSSVCIQRRSKLNQWKSALKPSPKAVSQN